MKKENNMSKQKFPRGSKVYITKDMPKYMSHFSKGCQAIVEFTYKQEYGGGEDGAKSYSLLILDEQGKADYTSAWYEEDQLTLLNSDVETGKKLIDQYYYG
jgi:hypothetical protein